MPTDEQRALWAAIRANPGDDTVRLAYADWLQEHGDEARAEFIRVQIEAVRRAEHRTERKRTKQESANWARCEQLLAPNRKQWTAEFVNAVRPLVDRNNRHEIKRRRQWWVSLRFWRGFLAPSLDGAELVRLLAAEQDLEPLESLALSLHSQDDVERLFTAISQSQLRSCLTNASVGAISDDTAPVIAASECLTTMTYFSARRAGLTDTGLTALAATKNSRMSSLDLSDNHIGDEGTAALARSPLLSAVTNLHLSNNRIGDAGAIALAESPHLQQLVWLTLGGNGIGPVGWRRLQERFEQRVSPRPQLS